MILAHPSGLPPKIGSAHCLLSCFRVPISLILPSSSFVRLFITTNSYGLYVINNETCSISRVKRKSCCMCGCVPGQWCRLQCLLSCALVCQVPAAFCHYSGKARRRTALVTFSAEWDMTHISNASFAAWKDWNIEWETSCSLLSWRCGRCP